MTLKEIISNVNWLHCEPVLKRLYPEQHESSAQGYEEILSSLKSMAPDESDMVLCIEKVEEEDDDEIWWDVSGFEDGTNYSLSFSPWSEWLGMKVLEDSLNQLSLEEIAIHCIWEMTWHGFDEEAIQEQANELKEAINEAINIEAESMSFDELKQGLGIDDE